MSSLLTDLGNACWFTNGLIGLNMIYLSSELNSLILAVFSLFLTIGSFTIFFNRMRRLNDK